jgi:hypothetical protein
MQTMRAEMNALRQAPAGGANLGGAPGTPGNAPGANPGGAPVVPPERPLDLEHADCPPGTRGPSARCCGLSETLPNENSKPRQIKSEAEQEHEEHRKNSHVADCPPPARGLSAPCGQS